MIRLCAFSDEADGSLQGQIDALKANGISLTELRFVDGKNVKDLKSFEAAAIRNKLLDNGICVWSVGSPIGKVDIGGDLEKYMDEVKHVCDIARRLGTDKVRMFSFFHAYEQGERVMEYLQKMVEIAKDYEVSLCHENEKDIYGDTAERVMEIRQRVPKLKHVYDPANFLQVGEPAEKTLATLHQGSEYFHIKDVIAQTGELVPAGYGDGKILELVQKIEGDKVLTIEPHLAVFAGYEKIDGEKMKNKFTFSSNREAFDAAVKAIKDVLAQAGYEERNGRFYK